MDRINRDIECPYFSSSTQRKINCEAVSGDAVLFTMTFENNKKRDEYIHNFCCYGCWKGCPIVKLIEEKS